ncbi:MAG: hypothetical protein KBB54_04160 [Candidatus Pacebacteria bacterium]|nr:hypothetical protein [Candidatus Paceibacterota bacterium]MBP9687734.1 hypothetical protein [Candidatus Woesebacteria bacterium]
MHDHNLVAGTPVVLRDNTTGKTLQLDGDRIYCVQSVQIFPLRTLLPRDYIEVGYIPDQYARHLINGIATTNHDIMESDRIVTVDGREFSGVWFRPATDQEVNQHAKAIL